MDFRIVIAIITHYIIAYVIELCDTIDTTRYRDIKQYRSTSSFGIVGIDYASYNQTGDDFGSHFQLIWIKLVG